MTSLIILALLNFEKYHEMYSFYDEFTLLNSVNNFLGDFEAIILLNYPKNSKKWLNFFKRVF